MPEKRLNELCHHLDVSPDYFTAGAIAFAGPDAEALEYFVASPEGVALYRAISALPDLAVRTKLVMAIGAFCDSQIRPEDRLGLEDGDARALVRWLRQMTLKRRAAETGGGLGGQGAEGRSGAIAQVQL